ncbi:MAG: leucine-rich repeat domain-containing protein [Treponema sp.]|jgi:hypothetical protein|nr:leucine-rich repeat domain-containing protein [Treponema sp.]
MNMRNLYTLIMCMTASGAALFAQTNAAADFSVQTTAPGEGVGIAGYYGQDGKVVIPETIGRERVAYIGAEAFYGHSGITSVTIPAGVAYIGAAAFAECGNLKAITVSADNQQYKDIDGVLFAKDGKTLIAYPGGGKSDYTMPTGVASIDDFAFFGCSNLVSVTMSASVASVGARAFAGCDKLKPEVRADIERRFGSEVF